MISSQETIKSELAPSYFKNDRREAISSTPRIFNDYGEEIFMVGQKVPAGTYRQVDSSRLITLETAGPLPPSFDGKRAEYCRVERPWVAAISGRG